MKRNDIEEIPIISWELNEGKYVAFVSKNHANNAGVLTFISTILAAAESLSKLWEDTTLNNENTAINVLNAANTNTENKAIVIHYIPLPVIKII